MSTGLWVEVITAAGARFYSSGGQHYGEFGTTSRSVVFGFSGLLLLAQNLDLVVALSGSRNLGPCLRRRFVWRCLAVHLELRICCNLCQPRRVRLLGFSLTQHSQTWWLRSPLSTRADAARCVASTGDSASGNGIAGSTCLVPRGVAFGFPCQALLSAAAIWWLRSPVGNSWVEAVTGGGARLYSGGGQHYGDGNGAKDGVAFGSNRFRPDLVIDELVVALSGRWWSPSQF